MAEQDLLMRYAIALETFNVDEMEAIFQMIEQYPGLDAAIDTLHASLDCEREIPEHLTELRKRG